MPDNKPTEEEILIAEADLIAKGLVECDKDGAFYVTSKGLDVMEKLLEQDEIIEKYLEYLSGRQTENDNRDTPQA